MQDFFRVSDEDLSYSFRALRTILKRRGWREARMVWGGLHFFELTRPDGKTVRLSGTTPSTTDSFALRAVNDKIATYHLLNELGVRQPETAILRGNVEEKARRAEDLLRRHRQIVIKPIDSAHGRGITTGISEPGAIGAAIANAETASPSGLALAQQQLANDAPETRVICIDYKFVGAFRRIPAAVTGDGQHSLVELIDLENATIRTEAYRSDLAFIDKPAAVRYLAWKASETGMTPEEMFRSVPKRGERVRVMGACNIGMGGTKEDISAELPETWIAGAERIARFFRLPVVGIDYYGDYVIELNASPALYHPVPGPAATNCIEALVDYLESI